MRYARTSRTVSYPLPTQSLPTQPLPTPPEQSTQRINHSVRISRPAIQLYRAWKDLATGQAAQLDLQRAAAAGFAASAVIKAPCVGDVCSALLTDHIPGLFFAWQSLPHASVQQRGEVWFHQTSVDHFSEVSVILTWDQAPVHDHGLMPVREHARAQIEQDLDRFKQLMEP